MNASTANRPVRDLFRRIFHLHDEPTLTEEEKLARHRRRVEVLIYVCWGLIVLKAFVVVWAVDYFSIPFNPLWVIAPTVAFAFLATAAYYWLRD